MRMRFKRDVWRILVVLSLFVHILCTAQIPSTRQTTAPPVHSQTGDVSASSGETQSDADQARDELLQGTRLTRQGRFKDAIPYLEAARGKTSNEYALEFNLSLCFIGIGDYKKAIPILDGLRRQGRENADVDNLLAQAYVGTGQHSEVLAVVERAAEISPQNEKLFTFVADACRDSQDFELGLKVVEIGLKKLPQSARLHYERGMFLTQLDQFDRAKDDFELAGKLEPGSEIGYVAGAQENLLAGNVPEAIRIAREGIHRGFQNPALLVSLGKALLRSGITPGQPEFSEAQDALEKAVIAHPRDAGSRIALGQVYLLGSRIEDAIANLEAARQVMPDQPSIYASLAKAYQRKGDARRAQEALAQLESLNQAQAERIRSAPGERKMSYGGNSSPSPQ